MNDETEKKEKQEYLRINILEKGYDADEFMNYLQILKGEKGLEINNWSKNDLIKAVHDFISINPKEIKNSQNENIIRDQDNGQINNNENGNSNAIHQANDNDNCKVDNDIKFVEEEYINCKTATKTSLSSIKELEITVSDPNTVEGGFFSKSYITYLVKTFPFSFEVRRRFSDFEWLRNTLMNQYTNCIIPPLYKKSFFKSINDYRINKRVTILQTFITEVAGHPLLKGSQLLYDFLTIKEEKEYNNKKDVYNKYIKTSKIEEINSLNGIINVGITTEKDLIAENIKKICENNDELMKKLSKEYKLLNNQIELVVAKMKTISNIWDELYKKGNQQLESETILGIYDIMAKLMQDWATMQENQINSVNKKIREYFRYIRNEYKAIKDYYDVYDNEKNQFIRAHMKLLEDKTYLYLHGNFEDWGLPKEDLENKIVFLRDKDYAFSKMLPEDTKKVNDYRKTYGVYLNSLIEQYQQISDLNKRRHKEYILNFIKEMVDNITSFHVNLNNLISYLDIIKEDIFI